MSLTARYTVRADPGRFGPGAFTELLHNRITLPGLDPLWRHTLLDAQVAADGATAELTVASEPPHARPMHNALRVVTSTPAARVRVVDEDGHQLHEGEHSAPLQAGQTIDIGGERYLVSDVSWPGRHPETGVCAGDHDWQVASVIPRPLPATVPAAAS